MHNQSTSPVVPAVCRAQSLNTRLKIDSAKVMLRTFTVSEGGADSTLFRPADERGRSVATVAAANRGVRHAFAFLHAHGLATIHSTARGELIEIVDQ